MKKLKNLLLYDASNYIHLGIVVLSFYITRTSYLGYVLLIPELIFLFKKSKNILIYSLIILVLINLRFAAVNSEIKRVNFPLTGTVIEVNDDSFTLKSGIKYLCYYDSSITLKPGLVVEINGFITDTDTYDIIHTFDYELYLKSENIYKVVNVNKLVIKDEKFSIYMFKHRIKTYIDVTFNKQTASYLKLFVLGENVLDNETKNVTSRLGIAHLFAISGMHLALITSFLKRLLRNLNITRESTNYIIIVFLIFFNIITGFKSSIIRASFLVIGITLNKSFNLVFTKTDILTLIFIILLLINPFAFYSLGFQLSFLISTSIIIASDLLESKDQVVSLLKVTLLATIISLPITLEITNQIGLIFLIANLFFIIYISYLFLPLSFLTLILPMLNNIYMYFVRIFEGGAKLLSSINLLISFNLPTNIHKLLFYFAIYMILINLKNRKKLVLYCVVMIIVLTSSISQNYPSNRFVRVLDVSQGDAIHIHDNDCDMLIDTGKSDNYNNLIDYFKGNNTYNIDILLITHFHSDHYGEVEDIINTLDVKTVYLNKDYDNITHYEVIKEGFCFNCGDSTFLVLNSNNSDSNENNNSIVLYAVIANDKYLFTGDIEQEIEDKIINKYSLDVDILKVPHHGSDTSSSNEFLKAINGETALVSVGENNNYNLPSYSVLNDLKSNNYDIYRTDELGSITIYYYDLINIRVIEFFQKQNRRRYIL